MGSPQEYKIQNKTGWDEGGEETGEESIQNE
jgi:hypothetical protein